MKTQPILPTLGLPAPSGVVCSPQVLCWCPTRRTAAGDTERPRLASSWADSYLAEGCLLDHHLTIAASMAPAMQFFKTGTQAVPAEALVHAKRRSTAIGKVFGLIDFTNLDQSPQRRDAIGSGSNGKTDDRTRSVPRC
jgi:hypothetical protein